MPFLDYAHNLTLQKEGFGRSGTKSILLVYYRFPVYSLLFMRPPIDFINNQKYFSAHYFTVFKLGSIKRIQ